MSSTYSNLSDEEILSLITSDEDRKAFEELYCRYSVLLFNYIYGRVAERFTTQEILQEIFLSLWQRRKNLVVGHCKPYLFSAAKNLIISHYRKEIVRHGQNTKWQSQRVCHEDSTYQHALADDLQTRYEEGLHLLPPKCQQVFVLSRQGLPNRDVAHQLGISEKTVEQHISRALRILRGYLKEHLVYGILFFYFF